MNSRKKAAASWWPAFAALAMIVAVGCTPPPLLVPVSGVVMLDGKPLPSGVVQFQPAAGQSASGDIAADGTFVLSRNTPGDGVPPGTYRVAVISYDPTAEVESVENLRVPVKYTRFGSSGIEFTVFPGAVDPFVIELASDTDAAAIPGAAGGAGGESESRDARGASDGSSEPPSSTGG